MTKIQHARELYFSLGKTQKQIATEVGVSERTIRHWISQNNWQRVREASYHSPAIIADNISMQIVELQNDIAGREPGKCYPTNQEADVLRKLINALEKLKKYPTASLYEQVFATFYDYVRPVNADLASRISVYKDRFLDQRSKHGFLPHELEYMATHVIPLNADPEVQLVQDELPQDSETPAIELIEVIPETNFLHKPATTSLSNGNQLVDINIAPATPEIIGKNRQTSGDSLHINTPEPAKNFRLNKQYRSNT